MINTKYETISSTKNQWIHLVKELLAKKTKRDEYQQFVVEGVRISEEVFKAQFTPEIVFFSENLSPRGYELVEKANDAGARVFYVSSSLLNTLSETETSQGILMVVRKNTVELPQNLNFVVVIDQLRDPGNLGTILRTSLAAGVNAVFVTPGSVDPYSPKVLRSGMGAHFRLPVINMSWEEIKKVCVQNNPPLQFALAESANGKPLWEIDLKKPSAIIIGGEANGASPEIKRDTDLFINIPMPGEIESLNAATAASIILFEVVRQRYS